MLLAEKQRLVYRFDSEKVWIEPWGKDALRVRATKATTMPENAWALQEVHESVCEVKIGDTEGSISNGNIRATLTAGGKLTIYNAAGAVMMEEFVRNRHDPTDPKCSALSIEAREFKPIPGGDYHLTMRFESLDRNEKIYGMGQYQQPDLDLKGHDLELAHRNSQASVPFALSSRGYGILWNNPAIGRAVFGKNVMSFEAYSTNILDYWVVVAQTPSDIIQQYASVTGRVPMMPEYGLGFWQCKLRYQTQDEVLQVARKHKSFDLPLDVIVIDYFHWPRQGEWKFDATYWPDPDAMVKELNTLGIEVMVSIWPTVDKKSENFQEMLHKGLLIRTDRGIRTAMDCEGETIHIDATNPEARAYLWDHAKRSYHDKGIKIFWLDEAEPEYTVYDFDNYRYHLGSNLQIGNVYPVGYAQAFYEGMQSAGQDQIVNLLRCAWAGSQRYGALVWSGDIASSWSSFRNQLSAGLNMGIAGIPWWTTDIGGFHGGNPDDPAFRELFVRWFQWATFFPVMRLHGDREPRQPQQGTTGGASCRSGADNEVWSYGPAVFAICKKYIFLRETLRPYTRRLMREAHELGSPVMRTCFYEFPRDTICWEVEDQYMFGPEYLCAPILNPGQTSTRTVYLPAGAKWIRAEFVDDDTGRGAGSVLPHREWEDGGKYIEVNCPLDTMPVFRRQT